MVISGCYAVQAQVSQKYFGRAGRSEIISGHTILNNGNKIAVGAAWTGTAMSTSDAFIMCLDAADNILWAKEISTPGNDRFISVTATSDGGCVAVGYAGQSSSSIYSGNHAAIYKFDAVGNILWNRLLNLSANGETFYYVVEVPGSGNIACAGCYSFGAGVSSSLLVNFDNAGNFLWAKTYDKTGTDEFRGLALWNGKLIASGIFQGSTFYDGTLVAVDEANGNMIWGRSFEYSSGFGGNNSQWPSSLQISHDRIYADVYLSTNYNPGTVNPTLVSFDTNGLNPICLEYPISGYSNTSDIHSTVVSPNEIYLVQSPGSVSWNQWFGMNVIGTTDAVLTKITSMTNAGNNMVYTRKLGNAGDQTFNSIRIHNNRILGFGSAKNDLSMLIGGQDAFMLYADNDFPVTLLSCVEDVPGQRFANPSVTLNPNFTFTEATRTFPNPSLTPTVTSVHLSAVDPCPATNYVIINHYAAVLGTDSCTNTFSVDDPAGFNAGDTVLMIQMKGAQIDQSNSASFGTISDYGNAGNYEFNVIQLVTGNNITLRYALTNDYDIPGGKVQFVRVPYYQDYTVSQTHSAMPWDGNKGGVFAVHVAGTLTLDADIDVSGYGFQGGAGSANHQSGCSSMDYSYPANSPLGGHKGESIADIPVTTASGRGSAAGGGGGGNHVNSGGGGGGNFGSGGRGGNQYDGCSALAIGGEGGRGLSYSNALNKVFLGSGGGGGHQNENATYPGTPGGGLVFIEANLVVNNSAIRSNGKDNNTVTVNDGASGGGAGGAVLISATSLSGTGDIEIKGGKGGDLIHGIWGGCHGSGGGGGGGAFWIDNILPGTWSVDVSGGIAGVNLNACGQHGSTAGMPGGTINNLVLPKSNVLFDFPTLPQLTSNSPLCAGDTLRLSITNSYPADATYSWTGQGGFTSNDQDPIVPNRNVTDSGIYTASVSLYGCTISDTVRITIFELPAIDLGNDTSVCLSQTPVTIRSPQPVGSQYLWSDGSSAAELQVSADGEYWLQVTDVNGCINRDTVNVNVTIDPVFDIGNDTLICQNNSITIGANVPNATHQWNTGSANPFISVGTTGTYILEVDLEGCIVRDTLELTVSPLPVVDLGNDTGICLSRIPLTLLSPQPSVSTYLWQDLSTNASFAVNSSGTYWLQVTDSNGCINRDSVNIDVVTDPVIALGNDTTICAGNQLRIGTNIPQATYQWNNGSNTGYIDVSVTGTYALSVDLQGCVGSDTIDITVSPLPVVDLGNDTGICLSQIPLMLLSPQPSGSTHLWQDLSTNASFAVNSSGTYWLQVTDSNGCINRDSVNIDVVTDPVIALGNDTTICAGNQLRIGTNIPQATYQWNNGSNTEHIDVSEAGTYILTADLGGCIVSDTIIITVVPPPGVDLGSDRIICPDETITLDGESGNNNTYVWNTGATTQTISVSAPGLYIVTVTSAFGCIHSDSILLTGSLYPKVSLGDDTSICEGGWLLLTPKYDYTDVLTWQDGSNEPSFRVTQAGVYNVTATNQCGTAADSIQVITTFCDIWLPNVFTPNGDGMNDVFRVLGSLGRLQDFEFSIYNRWGQQIFYTTDPVKGWDGRFKGIEQQVGTYVYLLKYKINASPHTLKGNFHLIR